MPITRHCETTFCDDIRHETSGKMSLIGVYGDTLLVSEFPAQLPKLCVVIKVVSPASDPLSSLTIRVLMDDTVFKEITIPDEELERAFQAMSGQDGRNLVATFILNFTPIHFPGPTTLKVRAVTEREELWGLGLIVAEISEPGE